ncbi:MAG: hypothetical protein K2X93_03320 [Candidatus Obscuribacterales bacterium]|nr:hypothetical protein [Candidatus Obscuribacterales bacterium]
MKEAIATDDSSCEAKIKYAEFLNGEHRYKEAEHQLALAQKLKDSCEIHVVRSEIFKSENKYDLSVAEISKAISMRPNDANLFEKRSDLFASQSKYKESMRDLDVAIQMSEGYTNKIVDLTSSY